MRLGRRIHRRIVGHVHQVFADDDQLAPYRQIVNRAPVGLCVDDGRCGSGKPSEILRDCQFANWRLRSEEGLERDRGGMLPGLDQLAHHLEQLAMQRLEEMRGLQEARDPVEGLVIDEDRAEQSLLGFDVVGGLPERQRVEAFLKGRRGGKGG